MKSLFTLFIILGLFSSSSIASGPLADGLYAEITMTKGKIIIKLEYEKVPLTVANFVGLVEGTIPNNFKKDGEAFYDGRNFWRVIADGMIQGGCPEDNGFGNPGYKFKDEFNKNLAHDKAGTVSMANSGKNTNGSQFFITHRAIPSLDYVHTVFGYVVEGMDVVNGVVQGDVMTTITIKRVGEKAKTFDPTVHFTEKDRKKTK